MLFGPGDDEVTTLLQQAVDQMHAAVDKVQHTIQLFEKIKALHAQADMFAIYALFPLCVTLLLLHENAQSVTEGRAFRLQFVVGKTLLVIIALVCYGQLCHLITNIAGAGGGWLTTNGYEDLTDWDKSKEALGWAWDNSSLGDYICIVLIWVIVMCAALFAYIVNQLMSLSQAVLITLLLGLGKICIVVELVPGVHVAKGWAKALGQVAAWSTVAGVITHLLATKNESIRELMMTGKVTPMLKMAAHFVILAICTMSIPVIVAKLFHGAAPHAVGAIGAVFAGLGAAKVLMNTGRNIAGDARERFAGWRKNRENDGEGGGGGGGRRIHKLPLVQRVLGMTRFQPVVRGNVARMVGGAQRKGRNRPPPLPTERAPEPQSKQGDGVQKATEPDGPQHGETAAGHQTAPQTIAARPATAAAASAAAIPGAPGLAAGAAAAEVGAQHVAAARPAGDRPAQAPTAPDPKPAGASDAGGKRVFIQQDNQGMRGHRAPPVAAPAPARGPEIGRQRIFVEQEQKHMRAHRAPPRVPPSDESPPKAARPNASRLSPNPGDIP